MEELIMEYNEQSSVSITDSSYECYWDGQWYDSEQGGWVETDD